MAEEKPTKSDESSDAEEAEESDVPEETQGEAEIAADGSGAGILFSPEAIIMFLIAGILDIIGLILLLFALDDFFTTDLIGIFFIGGWIYFRSQTVKVTRGAAARMGKRAKWASRLKWLRPLMVIGELIPYVGAAPCWTALVYFELQS